MTVIRHRRPQSRPNVLDNQPNVRARHVARTHTGHMGKYSDKKAVVTGGSTGIGFGVAKALIAEGAEVLITGRDPESLERARRELGERAQALRSDTALLRDIDELGSHVERTVGSLDLVFLNAGYCKLEPFSLVSEATYDHTFAVNTKGVFFSVQRLAPLVRDGGAFVFTTSIADAVGYPAMSVYSGTKAAILAFGRVFAAELLPRNIRVNAVSPGFVKTPTMGIYGASPQDVAAFQREGDALTPMKRIATVDEVARAVLFLGFEATFTTGTELVLDGGITTLVPPTHS